MYQVNSKYSFFSLLSLSYVSWHVIKNLCDLTGYSKISQIGNNTELHQLIIWEMKFKKKMSIIWEANMRIWQWAIAQNWNLMGFGFEQFFQTSFIKIKSCSVPCIKGQLLWLKVATHAYQWVTCHRSAPVRLDVNSEIAVILRALHLHLIKPHMSHSTVQKPGEELLKVWPNRHRVSLSPTVGAYSLTAGGKQQ